MTEALVFVIGLAVGSFLNVCIHRMPKGESIVVPGSYCPKCRHAIAWFDNVPLLSFLILGGRCRHCRERISFRYPLVEFISGLLWYGCWQAGGGILVFGIRVTFLSLLFVATMTDFESGLIPNHVTLLGMGAGLAASFLFPGLHHSTEALAALGWSALGLGVGGGLLYITAVAGSWIFQREAMGGGDVKLLAMIGSFLGWEKALLTFFTAPVLALPFALYQRWAKNEDLIPYGPFLALAGVVQFFYGDVFWRYFLVI